MLGAILGFDLENIYENTQEHFNDCSDRPAYGGKLCSRNYLPAHQRPLHGGCGTPPFGTVTVTQVGANVDVSISLNNGNRFVLTGAADSQYFKFNGTGVALGDITVDQTAAGVHLIADAGAFNGDGTGNFTFGITCDTGVLCGQGGSNALAVGTVLTFHVANATIADLTAANNLGNIFVADILSGSTGNTGPVDVTGSVPDGGTTLMLLGSALGALGLFRRSVRR